VDITQVRRSRGYQVLVRVGLASYGLVHLVLAWIALQIAFGRKGDASSEGALNELSRESLGRALLWIMAVGLFSLVPWQLLEATIGREEPGRDGRLRRRIASAGRAVVYLALGLLAVGVAVSSNAGSGDAQETVRRIGTTGYCAKGVALGIIGGLFIWAGVSYDADKAGGMDAAQSTVRDQLFGTVLLVIMALGIAAFAVYCSSGPSVPDSEWPSG
jgi:Domain of Unknown Function (DUF1206)